MLPGAWLPGGWLHRLDVLVKKRDRGPLRSYRFQYFDRALPSHSVISAIIKTLAKSEGARSGPREPRKAPLRFCRSKQQERG
jgi:hypothetical protein